MVPRNAKEETYMSGIGSLGPMGMPDHQYKSAMITNSAHAAQGTGKARDHEKSEHAHQEVQQDDNDMVTLSFTQQPDDAQQAQQKEKQQEARQKGNDSKMERQRMHSVSGHAAMALGSKDKAKEKEAKQADDGGDPLTILESAQTELSQAGVTGALQESAKEAGGKKADKESRISGADMVKERLQGNSGEEMNHQFTVKPEMIEKIMNRPPDEILKDVPPQFRAASEAMVKGQISQAGKPNQTLTEMKTVPQGIDCKALELMPAEEHPVMDIWVDAPPIPDLSEQTSTEV